MKKQISEFTFNENDQLLCTNCKTNLAQYDMYFGSENTLNFYCHECAKGECSCNNYDPEGVCADHMWFNEGWTKIEIESYLEDESDESV